MADDEMAGTEWSSAELDAIVADYFAMLRAEQAFDRIARQFDPALRDELNRALGRTGEERVY